MNLDIAKKLTDVFREAYTGFENCDDLEAILLENGYPEEEIRSKIEFLGEIQFVDGGFTEASKYATQFTVLFFKDHNICIREEAEGPFNGYSGCLEDVDERNYYLVDNPLPNPTRKKIE